MRKFSSAFARLLMLILIIIVGVAVALVSLSSFYFQDIYAASLYDTITGGLREAEKMLVEARFLGMLNLQEAGTLFRETTLSQTLPVQVPA